MHQSWLRMVAKQDTRNSRRNVLWIHLTFMHHRPHILPIQLIITIVFAVTPQASILSDIILKIPFRNLSPCASPVVTKTLLHCSPPPPMTSSQTLSLDLLSSLCSFNCPIARNCFRRNFFFNLPRAHQDEVSREESDRRNLTL